MFGKWLYRLIKYALIGAVALAVGGSLLSSVADLVISMRMGNYTPAVLLIVLSTILVWASERHHQEWKVADILIKILAGLVSLLLFMVVFLWLLPYGILQAIITTGAAMLYLNIVRRPSILRTYFDSTVLMSASLGPLTPTDRARLTHHVLRSHSVVMLPTGQADGVIELFKSRPHLPMVLSHYEEVDVLLIRDDENIESLLELLNIEGMTRASELLSRFILSIQFVEQDHGIELNDYVLVEDSEVVERLLETRPIRMSIIPHADGLKMIVPRKHTLGMNIVEIPREHRVRVLVGKDLTPLLKRTEVTPIAS